MYLLVMKLNIITPLVVGAKPVYPCGISSVIIGKTFRVVPIPGVFIIFNHLPYRCIFFDGVCLLAVSFEATQHA
jgi:hypothetical protein